MFGRVNPPGLVYKIDLSKIADRANPRTVEAPIRSQGQEAVIVDWGDGSTPEEYPASISANPSHDYTNATGDIFTVVIRSATGHFPLIRLSNADTAGATPTLNLTLAVTSVDHFAGWCGNSSTSIESQYLARNCANLTYYDPRLMGLPKWSHFGSAFYGAGLNQPLESFCLDFLTEATSFIATFGFCASLPGAIPEGFFDGCINVTSLNQCFRDCTSLTSIPAGLCDKNTAVTSFQSMFYNCSGLTGSPFVFWKNDGTLDKTKWPDLTTGNYCYSGCSAAVRAQVPVAYGGTMTVS